MRGWLGWAKAFVVLSMAFLFATAAHAERRVALVIGNSTYAEGGSLANPRNDAELMAATLQSVGFEVTKLIDADQAAMKRAMLDFGRKLRDGVDASLFYYAGHGIQVHGENYLVPVDAAIEDEGEVDIEAVNVNDFLQVMEGAASKVNIVVLDACRNNPFARSFRSASRGLAMVDAPRGTYIAFATAPGDVAADGAGGHSPYTKALTDAIVVPGLKLEDAFKQARRIVIEETGDKQVPWETTSITGDFYFVPSGEAADAEPAPVPEPAPAPEEHAKAGDAAPDDGAAPPAFDSYWTHNGSVVGLLARGDSRVFRYVRPRPGMVAAGAKPGDVVFEGTKNGDEVYGTAYVFSATCGRSPYNVAGFAEDGPRIVMEGTAPVLDKSCAPAGGKMDELVFEYLGKEPPAAEAGSEPPPEPKSAGEIAAIDDPAVLEGMLKRLPPNGPLARLVQKRLAALGRGDAPSLTRYPLRAMGKLDVPQTYLFDLDAGQVTEAGADVWFEAVTNDELYLVPRNGASLAPGDLSKRGPEECDGEAYSDAPIPLLDLPPGAFLCARTSDGRLSSFRIDSLSGQSPRTLSIDYATWQ